MQKATLHLPRSGYSPLRSIVAEVSPYRPGSIVPNSHARVRRTGLPPTPHGSGAQKGPEGPFARRLPSPDWISEYQPTSRTRRPFFRSAPGLDVCRPLTKDEHRVRFPAGAPRPRVGLLMTGHHRYGSPTLRVQGAHQSGAWGQSVHRRHCTYGGTIRRALAKLRTWACTASGDRYRPTMSHRQGWRSQAQ
jgi:hypothetical protein